MVQIRSDSPRGVDRIDVSKSGRSLRWTTSIVLFVAIIGTPYHLATRTVDLSQPTATGSTSTTVLLRGGANAGTTPDDQCRFYLAESAIPRSGLGLFTAINIPKGQEAQSMADICIYVADTPEKTHFETHSWARDVFMGTWEGEYPRGACEGFATLFNSMPPGVQTSKLNMLQTHDNGGLHRKDDPGAGAITHYVGISSVATRDIGAGSELTIDYGDWPYDQGRTYTAPSRTVPWLREHGMCIDNIRIKTATDPSMGRGAFVARNLKRGTLVSPVPLQFFPDRATFAKAAVGPEPLFINYCFSIGDTDMLLFPYGPGVNLINHASKKGTKAKPNVELRWSTHSMNHPTWLDLPMSQLRQMDYPGGLLLDVVALRDLKQGEELFLDYGDAWQAAWDEHVRTWTPDPSASSYVYAQDMDLTQPFRTVEEQQSNPYPANLATVCWTPNWERDKDSTMKWTKPTFDWPEGLVYCNIIKRTLKSSDSGSSKKYKENADSSQYEYEISINYDNMKPDKPDKLHYIDTNVPHNAIWFVDKPYKSDMHLVNAFRKPMALPQQLIPEAWLKEDTTDTNAVTKKYKKKKN